MVRSILRICLALLATTFAATARPAAVGYDLHVAIAPAAGSMMVHGTILVPKTVARGRELVLRLHETFTIIHDDGERGGCPLRLSRGGADAVRAFWAARLGTSRAMLDAWLDGAGGLPQR